ncbi:hypothetical protein ILUMI_15687 [Ignelater luminosus]|uniref:Uncharacterized protein n=1 Tax=Ignelater luminosus TaxID=2038154 RepID=A0A8K0CSK1_IGNLU|nr:hypothetical protein ILUMI_15687 [Ignelater luminosus]
MKFSDEEWFMINNLIVSLQPFKLGVEALCRRESTTFRFILDKLQKQDTVLSNQLPKSLRERIQERRTELIGVNMTKRPKIQIIHFSSQKKASIRQEIIRILERVIGVRDNDYESEVFEKTSEAGTAPGPALTLKEELEKQLKQEKETFKKKPDNKQKDYEKILKKEIACFESDGIRGQYLTLVDCLIYDMSNKS